MWNRVFFSKIISLFWSIKRAISRFEGSPTNSTSVTSHNSLERVCVCFCVSPWCIQHKMEDQNGSGKLSQGLRKVKPYLAILSLQFGYSGMYIITMVSFKHGMSHWILSVYRHVVAAIIIVPFALVLERYISLSHSLSLSLSVFTSYVCLSLSSYPISSSFCCSY